jgi:hypothetical protein
MDQQLVGQLELIAAPAMRRAVIRRAPTAIQGPLAPAGKLSSSCSRERGRRVPSAATRRSRMARTAAS